MSAHDERRGTVNACVPACVQACVQGPRRRAHEEVHTRIYRASARNTRTKMAPCQSQWPYCTRWAMLHKVGHIARQRHHARASCHIAQGEPCRTGWAILHNMGHIARKRRHAKASGHIAQEGHICTGGPYCNENGAMPQSPTEMRCMQAAGMYPEVLPRVLLVVGLGRELEHFGLECFDRFGELQDSYSLYSYGLYSYGLYSYSL